MRMQVVKEAVFSAFLPMKQTGIRCVSGEVPDHCDRQAGEDRNRCNASGNHCHASGDLVGTEGALLGLQNAPPACNSSHSAAAYSLLGAAGSRKSLKSAISSNPSRREACSPTQGRPEDSTSGVASEGDRECMPRIRESKGHSARTPHHHPYVQPAINGSCSEKLGTSILILFYLTFSACPYRVGPGQNPA
jgi:hypothetical protein